MNSFSLTNRKRAIIALVRAIIFLCVAALQTALSHAKAFSLHSDKVAGGLALLGIYAIVTRVLLILLRIVNHASERLYFALGATSAALGLLRVVLLGDPALHAGALRVLLLSCTVVVGTVILRTHSMQAVGGEVETR